MKGLHLLMAFYVLLLSLHPACACTELESVKNQTRTAVSQAAPSLPHDDDCQDFCNPFCCCSCYVGFIFGRQSLLPAALEQEYLTFNNYSYQSPVVDAHVYQVFQPPKQ